MLLCATIPISCWSMKHSVWFLKKHNSYLILQNSSLATGKIVQRKENFFLMRDYAQQSCNSILCHLFLYAIFSPVGILHFTYISSKLLGWEFGRPRSLDGMISVLVIAGNGYGNEGFDIASRKLEMTKTVTNTKIKKKAISVWTIIRMSDLLGLEEETRKWKNGWEEDFRINTLLVFKCNQFIRQALADEVLILLPSMSVV